MRASEQKQKIASLGEASAHAGLLQRKCACGGSPGLTGECAECSKKRLTSRQDSTGSAEPGMAPPVVHEVLRSPAQPLDQATRAIMEPRFGHDFSRVRVHTDAPAAESARGVNALAYTLHDDIIFGAGQYAPETASGARLLAHELAHTIQQGPRTHSTEARLELSHPADAAEREADSASNDISAARPVRALTQSSGVLNRQPALTGLGSAVKSAIEKASTATSYQETYRYLNGLEIGVLLDKLKELKRLGYLDGLIENFASATGVHRERLFMAMKAVELQGKVKRDSFATLFVTQMEKIKEADQREKILSCVGQPATGAAEKEKTKGKSEAGAAKEGGEPIPAEKLTGMATDEQTTFKRAVYNTQMQGSRKVRKFFPGVAAADLEKVEGGHRLHKDAAPDCRSLLTKARADLKEEQDAQNELALKVTSIGIGSSYRDPQEDFRIWDGLFKQYYDATKKERENLEGGEHGAKAISYLASYFSGRKAVPGFSNHTSGIAVDFVTTEGKESLSANVSQNERWKKSWLHIWLVKNAATYNFHPLATEAFHWDHKIVKE